ncbi:unnamed protein product [Didymodactylos carnosus]|uniref:hydroxyacylglutathione hydrolase n=1 Tax=Didymodactylos carnosus TaxID=1234261 RepID=A0A813PH01_9BILA|nr:unnamed protein product [Didymodactylos carnosus]CAF3529846.1 unnamed protein product [Didymodactylos carnosus]
MGHLVLHLCPAKVMRNIMDASKLHKADHAGGNENLVKQAKKELGLKDIPIYGGEKVQALTHMVKDNEEIPLGQLKITCLSTPCHTAGHICYLVDDGNKKAVFTGDTLFISGCGKFFEGTAEQMYSSLQKLAKLDPQTEVYCGHEYTLQNFKFAVTVEENNSGLQDRMKQMQSKKVTIPSTIGDELRYNPFMRTNQEDVQKYTGTKNEIECLAILREKKNNFKST